jgi:hypothetical protein
MKLDLDPAHHGPIQPAIEEHGGSVEAAHAKYSAFKG